MVSFFGRAGELGCNLSVWWGEAPFWPYDVNEAADVLIPKMQLGRKPRRTPGLQCGRGKRAAGLTYVTLSRVPTQCRRKTLTRGSARPVALQNQVTLRGSILCNHLQDDREPRRTNLLLLQ